MSTCLHRDMETHRRRSEPTCRAKVCRHGADVTCLRHVYVSTSPGLHRFVEHMFDSVVRRVVRFPLEWCQTNTYMRTRLVVPAAQ